MDNSEQKSLPINDSHDSVAQTLLQDTLGSNSLRIDSPVAGAADTASANLPVLEMRHHHGVVIYPYGQPFQRPTSTFNCDQIQVHNGVITTVPFRG
ncbi:MAG: hypothetical protein K2X81_02190 [Candidatus Obscuribacterales bacterium]|nr:hypothetical protein [Candidatus Obscuribacterales bacterium]